jgi:macrodomain Ter protein organizer (MatP/YcbG family)
MIKVKMRMGDNGLDGKGKGDLKMKRNMPADKGNTRKKSLRFLFRLGEKGACLSKNKGMKKADTL